MGGVQFQGGPEEGRAVRVTTKTLSCSWEGCCDRYRCMGKRERGGDRQTKMGKFNIIDEELQNHRGVAVSYQDAPPPPPLPINTNRTGRAGRVLKVQEVGQAVRGGQLGIGRQSVGQEYRRTTHEGSLLLMVDGKTNAKRIHRRVLRRRIEFMLGQGLGGGTRSTLRGGGTGVPRRIVAVG